MSETVNNAFIVSPQPLVLDKKPEIEYGRYEFTEPGYRNFEFNNRTPYYVALRWDWDESSLEFAPHRLLKPWCDHTLTLRGSAKRLCFMATSRFPVAASIPTSENSFWFQASNDAIQSSPSFPNVGVTEQPPVTVTERITEVSSVINRENPGISLDVASRFSGDTNDRLVVLSDGKIQIGDGTQIPASVWRALPDGAAGFIEFLNAVRLPGTGANGNDAATRGFVEGFVPPSTPQRVHFNTTDQLGPTAVLTYQEGVTLMAVTVGGGWPVDGLLVTFINPAKNRASQLLFESAGERIFARNLEAATTTWKPFRSILNPVTWDVLNTPPAFNLLNQFAITIEKDGFKSMRGRLQVNTARVAGAVLFTLAAAYRPATTQFKTVWAYKGGTYTLHDIGINDVNGDVTTPTALAVNDQLSFDDVRFF